jgi:hypothetical protein
MLACMRHLIVVHAGFIDYEPLAREDIGGVEILAASIHETLGSCRSRVISSTATPTMRAAEIIAKRLGVPVYGEKFLWTGKYAPEGSFSPALGNSMAGLLDIIYKHSVNPLTGVDGLVVVAHDEVCQALPAWYVHEMLNLPYELMPLQHGQAVHVDIDQKAIHYLPRKASAVQ